MGITNLPKPGIDFKATLGSGSFKRKLSGATRYGDLRNLRDNQEAIIKEIKKRQGVIRTKGGLSRLQQRDAWLKIKASDKTITKGDRREIKEVLKALGRGSSVNAKKPAVNGKLIKAGNGKSFLTEMQIKRNLNRAKQDRMDEPEAIKFAGDRAKLSSAKNIGVDLEARRGKIGFASQHKNNKLPDNSASKIPPAGVRPIGL